MKKVSWDEYKRAVEEEIQVPGFARLTRPIIQKKIKVYLDDIIKESKTLDKLNSLKKIRNILDAGVLKALLTAEIEEKEEEDK